MKRLSMAVVAVALATALTGCGSKVAPEPVAAVDAMPSETDTAAPEAGEAGDTATAGGGDATAMAQAPDRGADGATAPDAPQPAASPDYGPKHNNGVVRVELSATCVKPGDLLVITFRTPPKAGLGMIIGYSDNQPHGAMLTGESDANGVYVWRVPVAPTAPDGQATVLVTSTGANWEQEGGGTADAKFTVSRAGC